jgi:hypothetical protein
MRRVCTVLLSVMLAFGLVQAGRADIISAMAGPWGFGLHSPPNDVETYGAAYHRGHVTVLKSAEEGTTTELNGGLHQIDSFFDIFTELSLDGGSTPTWLPMEGRAEVRFTEVQGSAGFFDTEMLSMNLIGGSGWQLRESPSKQSTGQTRVQPEAGGQYHIDSFFDVFTELSVDGGQTWIPGISPSNGRVSGAGTTVPEPGTLLLLTTAALGLGLSWKARLRAKEHECA